MIAALVHLRRSQQPRNANFAQRDNIRLQSIKLLALCVAAVLIRTNSAPLCVRFANVVQLLLQLVSILAQNAQQVNSQPMMVLANAKNAKLVLSPTQLVHRHAPNVIQALSLNKRALRLARTVSKAL
jgi:hypothetical protein